MIRVGIVDTGIRYPDHPAIKDNIVLCANFSYDGRKSTDIFSNNTHGQAVASIITKVAPTVELVIAKALDDIGCCSSENAANGIRYCTALGCDIINCSIATNHSRKLEEAVKEATMNGVSNLRYIDKILYEWGKNGIKTVTDVENNRKKFKEAEKKNLDSDADLTLIDWNWFDDDE